MKEEFSAHALPEQSGLLAAIKQIVDNSVHTAINTRVKQIVDESISERVKQIVDESIDARVKHIVDNSINTHVKQIIDEQLEDVRRSISDLAEGQALMANMMVTHEELNEKLEEKLNKRFGELYIELDERFDDAKTHTSLECEKVRQDITSLVKKVDGRIDDVIATLHVKKILSRFGMKTLLETSPFL